MLSTTVSPPHHSLPTPFNCSPSSCPPPHTHNFPFPPQDVLRNASFSSSPLPAYTAKYVVYHLCKAGREASQVRLGCGLDVTPGASCHARLTFPSDTLYSVLV